jgi:hypothetical protein
MFNAESAPNKIGSYARTRISIPSMVSVAAPFRERLLAARVGVATRASRQAANTAAASRMVTFCKRTNVSCNIVTQCYEVRGAGERWHAIRPLLFANDVRQAWDMLWPSRLQPFRISTLFPESRPQACFNTNSTMMAGMCRMGTCRGYKHQWCGQVKVALLLNSEQAEHVITRRATSAADVMLRRTDCKRV